MILLISVFFRSSPFLKKGMGTLSPFLSPVLDMPFSYLEVRREGMETRMAQGYASIALMQLLVFPLRRAIPYTLYNQSDSLQSNGEHFNGSLMRKRTIFRDLCIGHHKHFEASPQIKD